jgi:hypothetical protein
MFFQTSLKVLIGALIFCGNVIAQNSFTSSLPNCSISGIKDLCYGQGGDLLTKYIGEWKNGKYDGQGYIQHMLGWTYAGEWKDGKKHGSGIYFSTDGSKYSGYFKNDQFDGRGTLYSSNGSIINSGDWKEGNFVVVVASNSEIEKTSDRTKTKLPFCPGLGVKDNCYGKYKTASVMYEGEFKKNKFDGTGSLTFQDIFKYIGEFKDGLFNGSGELIYIDGIKYVGSFKDQMFHGKGIKYDAAGQILESGLWDNDRLLKADKVSPTLNVAQQSINEKPRLSDEADKYKKEAEEAIQKQKELQIKLEKEQLRANVMNQAPTSGTIAPQDFLYGRRVALVIGNTQYVLHPLENPKNDADDISNALKSANFEVINLRDATLAQMRSSLRLFGDKLMSSDVGLVYYSGHGIESKGRNYLIPVNADIRRSDEIADQSLDMSLIFEKMKTAKKGVNILIVDACRDDPFGRRFRSGSRGLAQVDAPVGTIVAFSTSPGKVAADGEGRNSPYTKNLVKAIQQPNIPIEQVFKAVRREVQKETKGEQTPWENTSLSGDFYFFVKK